jgi:hypothetical protein
MSKTLLNLMRTRATALVAGASALVLLATGASAETLLMPPRDYLAGASEVVWGITTQANGTAYVLDYGDGSAQQTGTVTDRSYIAFNHTYALANTYTVSLCVGAGAAVPGCPGELATVQVQVFNGAVLSAENLRNLNVNRAIHNGFRYLWFSQANRTTFDTNVQTNWGNFPVPFTALVVTALENHGFKLPNNNSVPTGILPKYAVRRGINYVLANLTTLAIGVTPQGDDPCVSVPAPVCSALSAQTTGDPGYENALAILPFAASNALARVNTEVTAANVVNKTYGEILQRLVNATTWGQNDADAGVGRGGWIYGYNSSQSDGSTVGWDMLAIFDALAAGANVPVWVKNEWAGANRGVAAGLNNDGSFDYRAENVRTANNSVNVAKTGVGLQGMNYAGRPLADADVQNALTWLGARWQNQATGQSFVCGNGTYNKGCGYGMFNVFKGLRLYGVTTLSGVNRPAGPGAIPANDWYADYVDYLVANQTNPLATTGGQWNSTALYFSSQTTNDPANTALAELILAPTALIPPDPDVFSTVGLKQGNPLATGPDTNPVNTLHTVVATAQSTGGSVIPGVQISFQVTGRNAATGGGITDAQGQVSFSYTDVGPSGSPGQDSIRAFIGQVGSNLGSNILVKNWVVPTNVCDTDTDGDVDMVDILNIRAANRTNASGPTDPRDGNGDGKIDIADVRFCQLRMTAP